jgi:hypothetical protein
MTATTLTPASDRAAHRSSAEQAERGWSSLFKIGGTAAVIMLMLIPFGAIPFLVGPLPDTVQGWFALLRDNRLLGLALLDIPNLVVNVFAILLYLALGAALWRANASWMAVATTLGILAVALYIPTNPAASMLALNDRYVAAITEGQRALLLAAGQTILTVYQSSTAFTVSYLFGALATLLISIMMWQDHTCLFGKRCAGIGIAASLITLGLFVPVIGLYISIFSVLFYAPWLGLVARGLFKLGRRTSTQSIP